jgi:hypothetical protein
MNYIFHGLFIFGQALMFFGGVLLAAAFWPWKKEYRVSDRAYARCAACRWNAWLSSPWQSPPSAQPFSAPSPARCSATALRPSWPKMWCAMSTRQWMQKSIIGHLHIMLTLIGIAAASHHRALA